ncbi:hypothetical protein PsorP6_009766 [Peronosclerospora sorghi]|uniref:Uncharacterized protein n=1 Tax=Peronosclerospora sorghi TaxID=230839 RepID=A0ACC0VY32_9STRA|nr:hypothetical protein PsorP6_019161 [Peronosclerospora sorghi]KAI9911438.1 hypothetical protein PsorP6_009766 [Peronosclerospora sorghi]
MPSGVDQPLLSVTSRESCKPNSTSSSEQFRFLDRRGRFHQSLGHFNIDRKGGEWRHLYWNDPFHTLLHTRTSRILGGVSIVYFLIILCFALAYFHLSRRHPACHVGLSSLVDAYMFSLETIMTIGYGAPMDDIFYGHCTSMATLLTLEVVCVCPNDMSSIHTSQSAHTHTHVCGLLFRPVVCRDSARCRLHWHLLRALRSCYCACRATVVVLSREGSLTRLRLQRAHTILFSKSAVIRKIRGQYYFMVQTCERRKHQLVEAHVRLYAVKHATEREENAPAFLFQCEQMRIQQPDDDCGAMLLMIVPQIIVHRIDQWSPLFPPACRPRDGAHDPKTWAAYPNPTQRQVDMENGNRDGRVPTDARGFDLAPTKEQIRNHVHASKLEVLVILEGIDSSTSNTMQARYSYTEDDMAWDATFEQCVVHTRTGLCLDFDRFHLLKPAPLDAPDCVMSSQF